MKVSPLAYCLFRGLYGSIEVIVSRPIFGTMKSSAFSSNAKPRFASIVLQCPGISTPSATLLMVVSLYLCSSGSKHACKPRALEGRCAGSKSPSRVRDGDEEVSWEEQTRTSRRGNFPFRYSLVPIRRHVPINSHASRH